MQIIYLDDEGSIKAEIEPSKKIFGSIKGGAVHLGEPLANKWLVIGEGIETVLSAMQIYDLPAGWATLGTSGLEALVLPDQVKQVAIAVDNDLNGAGQKAAHETTERFIIEGRRVKLPQLWNVLKGEMSLVGPRPPLPNEVDHYDVWHRRRLSMKPGITGLVAGRGAPGAGVRSMGRVRPVVHRPVVARPWTSRSSVRTIPAVLVRSGR